MLQASEFKAPKQSLGLGNSPPRRGQLRRICNPAFKKTRISAWRKNGPAPGNPPGPGAGPFKGAYCGGELSPGQAAEPHIPETAIFRPLGIGRDAVAGLCTVQIAQQAQPLARHLAERATATKGAAQRRACPKEPKVPGGRQPIEGCVLRRPLGRSNRACAPLCGRLRLSATLWHRNGAGGALGPSWLAAFGRGGLV